MSGVWQDCCCQTPSPPVLALLRRLKAPAQCIGYNIELPLVLCVQEEDEAQEEEDASKLRDSIASMTWLQKHEGAAWAGSGAGDPIKQHKLQQAASIKKWVAGAKLLSMPVLQLSCCVWKRLGLSCV